MLYTAVWLLRLLRDYDMMLLSDADMRGAIFMLSRLMPAYAATRAKDMMTSRHLCWRAQYDESAKNTSIYGGSHMTRPYLHHI